jgi:Matrixin
MRLFVPACVLMVTAAVAGCARSSTAPSEAGPDRRLDGVTVSALDGAPAAGLSVQVGSAPKVTTDAAGRFTTEIHGPGDYTAVVSGTAIVERRTMVTGPSSVPTRLSLMPASFDLHAFDEMFRTANARLQRWTTRPSLVLLASVMNFRGDADEFNATSEQLTDAEVALLIAHLNEGLSLLTGGTYTSFAEVKVERPASGERTSVARASAIVVGRYNGVQTFARTIGYGRWAENADGSVVAGAMFLDHGFDKNDDRRWLLRIHELGHALGLLHVESRTSIMNPSVGPEPQEFDRQAAIIAFQRPPGNVSPDTDPGTSGKSTTWNVRWAAPVRCTLP